MSLRVSPGIARMLLRRLKTEEERYHRQASELLAKATKASLAGEKREWARLCAESRDALQRAEGVRKALEIARDGFGLSETELDTILR